MRASGSVDPSTGDAVAAAIREVSRARAQGTDWDEIDRADLVAGLTLDQVVDVRRWFGRLVRRDAGWAAWDDSVGLLAWLRKEQRRLEWAPARAAREERLALVRADALRVLAGGPCRPGELADVLQVPFEQVVWALRPCVEDGTVTFNDSAPPGGVRLDGDRWYRLAGEE